MINGTCNFYVKLNEFIIILWSLFFRIQQQYGTLTWMKKYVNKFARLLALLNRAWMTRESNCRMKIYYNFCLIEKNSNLVQMVWYESISSQFGVLKLKWWNGNIFNECFSFGLCFLTWEVIITIIKNFSLVKFWKFYLEMELS